jgi:uncharacterized protein (TIGR02996 family)
MTATDTESALLAAVRANPGEDAPRLVLADWLEENAGTVACGACKGEGKIGVGNNGNPYMAKCDECNGSACVSDGRAELAEFVRVQVELAKRNPRDCNQGTCRTGSRDRPCTACREREELQARERELWPAVRRVFEGDGAAKLFPVLGIDGIVGNAPLVLIRRGLPAVVRCTFAEWMGGEECPHCDRGVQWRSMPPDSRVCESCGGDPERRKPGTGRTPGIGPRLAQRWPVVAVEVTDVSPMNFSFGSMFACGSDESSLPDWLPHEIHAKFPTGKTWHTNNVDAIRNVRIFKDESAARAALSDALIAWARGQVIKETK